MSFLNSPIPRISISPPPADPQPEPDSPFFSCSPSPSEDSFRSHHLSPPTTATRAKSLSPLRPSECAPRQGLERGRFEALLQTARERNTAVGAKKAQDLRKEIALRAHKHKQVERRALFLSKVLAPPSPTATCTPKTPPDSPAIFHYTLPSPGLVSPLSLFESLGSGDPALGAFMFAREPWVEQVDFRLPEDQSKPKDVPKRRPIPPSTKPGKMGKPIPSLDQITAHLGSHRQVSPPPDADDENRRPSRRLPAFLRPSAQPAPTLSAPLPKPRPALSIAVSNRLHIHSRGSPQPDPAGQAPVLLPPKSPHSPLMPNLKVTTMVVPRTPTMSPTTLSVSNLLAFNSQRERTTKDMLLTLERRRAPRTECDEHDEEETEDRKSRRHSSPADLPKRERTGFEHPVLSMPGGF